MTTEKTQYLGWDKPVFPSDNLATELDTLIDQIDDTVDSTVNEGISIYEDSSSVGTVGTSSVDVYNNGTLTE